MAAIFQLLEMQTEENEKIKELRQSKISAKPPDLNAWEWKWNLSQLAASDVDETSLPTSPILSQSVGSVSVSYLDCAAEQAIKDEIASAKHCLKTIQAAKVTGSSAFDFKSCITEAETKLLAKLRKIKASDCQRLGTDNWKNIHYSEVQRQFQTMPIFSAFKVKINLQELFQILCIRKYYNLTCRRILSGKLENNI